MLQNYLMLISMELSTGHINFKQERNSPSRNNVCLARRFSLLKVPTEFQQTNGSRIRTGSPLKVNDSPSYCSNEPPCIGKVTSWRIAPPASRDAFTAVFPQVR